MRHHEMQKGGAPMDDDILEITDADGNNGNNGNNG